MIELIAACAILAAGIYVGFRLSRLEFAFERYGDRAFGVEEALRRLERSINVAQMKPEPKRRKS